MNIMSKGLMGLLLVGAVAAGDNLPTVHQIYQTAQAGNLEDAHRMVEQVLLAHPQSAKAHFVDAEILVRQGDMADAKNEFETAQKLSPGLPFAKPESVHDLQERLKGSGPLKGVDDVFAAHPHEKPFPWIMLILGAGAVLFIVMIIRAFSSRNTNALYPSGYGNVPGNNGFPNGGPGFGAGTAYPAQSGGLGSNIASGLAAGAAAGVGMVAGEALMHHFMDEPSSTVNNNDTFGNTNSDDMGGQDFGVTESSSWDNDSVSDSSDDSW